MMSQEDLAEAERLCQRWHHGRGSFTDAEDIAYPVMDLLPKMLEHIKAQEAQIQALKEGGQMLADAQVSFAEIHQREIDELGGQISALKTALLDRLYFEQFGEEIIDEGEASDRAKEALKRELPGVDWE
jgi:hypothetical protein